LLWTTLFVIFGGHVCSSDSQHSYDPLLAYFIRMKQTSQEKRKEASFNIMLCYIDDVISVNSFKLCDFVDRMLPLSVK
jgi:hypothetical protein